MASTGVELVRNLFRKMNGEIKRIVLFEEVVKKSEIAVFALVKLILWSKRYNLKEFTFLFLSTFKLWMLHKYIKYVIVKLHYCSNWWRSCRNQKYKGLLAKGFWVIHSRFMRFATKLWSNYKKHRIKCLIRFWDLTMWNYIHLNNRLTRWLCSHKINLNNPLSTFNKNLPLN